MEPQPRVLFIIPSIPVLGYCQISYALSDITANVFTLGGSTIKEPSHFSSRPSLAQSAGSEQGFSEAWGVRLRASFSHRRRNLLLRSSLVDEERLAMNGCQKLAIPTVADPRSGRFHFSIAPPSYRIFPSRWPTQREGPGPTRLPSDNKVERKKGRRRYARGPLLLP